MRGFLLLSLAILVGCDAPTEPRVVRRSASSYGFQQDTLLTFPASPVPCRTVVDSSVVWVNGMKYLEIVEQCL